jgi:quercetin dioxygenase-like cupin family protein
VTEVATLLNEEQGAVFESPRTVRLSLAAGESAPPHQHPEATVIFAVHEGRCDLQVGEETLALEAGDVARFDGAQDIAPTAREDLRALVVLVGT